MNDSQPSGRPDSMQTVYVVLNSLGFVGLAAFVWYVLKGLRTEIQTLRTTIDEQTKTLEAVRQRAEEFDRLSKGYKQALADYEEMGKKLEDRRKELVAELEKANAAKDEQIAAAKKKELEQVELQQHGLAQLPRLIDRIENIQKKLETSAVTTRVVTGAARRMTIGAGGSLIRETLFGSLSSAVHDDIRLRRLGTYIAATLREQGYVDVKPEPAPGSRPRDDGPDEPERPEDEQPRAGPHEPINPPGPPPPKRPAVHG